MHTSPTAFFFHQTNQDAVNAVAKTITFLVVAITLPRLSIVDSGSDSKPG